MTGPAIRDAEASDIGWIAATEVEIFGAGAWSLATIDDDWRNSGRAWRIAEDAAARIGYVVYGMDGDAFSLMNVAVVAQARGRGVGAALIADCLASAARAGAREISLEVAVDNEAAIALYRAHGFADVRVRRRYYQPEGTDALVMARAVDSAT